MPYSTVRKYVNALKKKGYISLHVTSRSVILNDHDIEVFDRFSSLIKSGVPFKTALEQLIKTDNNSDNDTVEYLRRLEVKINSLEDENRKLRELVQMYLSKVDDLQNQLMPSRKKGWFFKILKPKK